MPPRVDGLSGGVRMISVACTPKPHLEAHHGKRDFGTHPVGAASLEAACLWEVPIGVIAA
jgi:hypothetical protein